MANKHFYYAIPLLALLSVSPSELLKKEHSRSIASIEVEEISDKPEVKKEEEKKFERFQEMISKVDSSNLLVSQTITKESIKSKSQDLQSKITKDLESFNKEASDKDEIAKQRESIESLVVDKIILDKEFDVLEQKKELDEELKKELFLISESQKEGIENLLIALEKNEELLDVEPPKLADSGNKIDDDKKDEEPKKEEPEEEPKVASDDKQEDKKEETCAASEQVKLLTTQIEKLMEEQNLILQAMLNLSQAMVNMSQNMQQQQPYFPMPQTAYQYNAPMAQGNWVYYPQGNNPMMNQNFYPNQANNMQSPAQGQQGMVQNQAQGFQQNLWNLQPTQSFQFSPQNQAGQMPVGQFGMNGPSSQGPMNSFNFSSNQMPLVSYSNIL